MADVKWYVVRAVSGQERKVKTYLDNEIRTKWNGRNHHPGAHSFRKSI